MSDVFVHRAVLTCWRWGGCRRRRRGRGRGVPAERLPESAIDSTLKMSLISWRKIQRRRFWGY